MGSVENGGSTSYERSYEIISEDFQLELNNLKLNIKKESFKAEQQLKDEIKRLGFYDGNENGENIKFNIAKVKEYLRTIKDKTWSELSVQASKLEKGVRTIAIQAAINYINVKNGESSNSIDWLDGVRGSQTWKGVKQFQIKYNLKNTDGLPGRETINKLLELLNDGTGDGKETVQTDIIQRNPSTQTNHTNPNNVNPDSLEETLTFKSNKKLDNKYVKLFKNLKFSNTNKIGINLGNSYSNGRNINSTNNSGINLGGDIGNNATGESIISITDRLKTRFNEKIKSDENSELEGIILNNNQVQDILANIISHQGQEIEAMKNRFIHKFTREDDKIQNDPNSGEKKNKVEMIQSLDEYKYEKASSNSFEEFVLSEEGIAIIINEIKSHVNTDHVDENGEYDNYYEKYPLSAINLEIRLKAARENKIQKEYYTTNKIYDEEKDKLDVISDEIIGYVDQIVGEYMKGGNEDFNKDMIDKLEGLLSQGANGVDINELFSDPNNPNSQKYKDTFYVVLANKIKKYGMFARNKDDINLDTGDKQVDLQLKCYLYIYGKIFYSNFSEILKKFSYSEILPDVMRIIMSGDDTSLLAKIKNAELLEAEKKLEEQRDQRDLEMRIAIAKRNREMNEHLQGTKLSNGNSIDIHTKQIDPNNATGMEIAANARIGEQLHDFHLDINEPSNELVNETAFLEARKSFINHSANEIKSIITPNLMRKFFDVNTGEINKSGWNEFINKDEIRKFFSEIGMDQAQMENIPNTFKIYFIDTRNELNGNVSDAKIKIGETVKTYAIGTVIDNVRNIFSTMGNRENKDKQMENLGFELNVEEPVKLDEKNKNNVIISGYFNGSEVKVRYDLETGELFINSYFGQDESKEQISIANESEIKIGNIDSFDDVLNNYKPMPSVSEDNNVGNGGIGGAHNDKNRMHPIGAFSESSTIKKHRESRKGEFEKVLNSQVDLISNNSTLKQKMEIQAQKNSAIINFLRTFNITSVTDSGDFNKLVFKKGSNLFDFMQIIKNTGNIEENNSSENDIQKDIQSLEYFNNEFMPIVTKYAGLQWGVINKDQDQKNYESEKIFNYTGSNENINYLKNKTKDFKQESEQFLSMTKQGNTEFEESYSLGFADIIIHKTSVGVEPNWKLDKEKMENFKRDLTIEGT